MSRPLRHERLAELKPTGEVFVNGLSSSYDDEFPTSERLVELMTREDFAKAVSSINDALIDHWPCLPCKGFGYGCCICTLGLSLYCAASQVREAERRLQLQLRRLNDQKKFKDKGIQWRLARTWWRPSSFVEIYIDPDVRAEHDSTGDEKCATRE
uniref:Golgin subfamily A member 7/ERF4 domain-containing protein n=1 Tax=Peronospora matthiolae TaxID=2874970 RepID=A0AAV1UPH2_9STRA